MSSSYDGRLQLEAGRVLRLGSTVLLSVRAAAWLAGRVRLVELETEVRGADPELHAVVQALRHAQLAVQEERSVPQSEPTVDDLGSVAGGSGVGQCQPLPLTAAAAAVVAGVTDRAVRKAAASGRLPGRRVAGAWMFEEDAVVAWMSRRTG